MKALRSPSGRVWNTLSSGAAPSALEFAGPEAGVPTADRLWRLSKSAVRAIPPSATLVCGASKRVASAGFSKATEASSARATPPWPLAIAAALCDCTVNPLPKAAPPSPAARVPTRMRKARPLGRGVADVAMRFPWLCCVWSGPGVA